MKKHILSISALASAALLAGCSSSVSATLEQKLKNPLFAEQYYDELVDSMVTLEIQNDDLTKEDATKNVIEETRVNGLAKAKEANALQVQGKNGRFISDEGYSIGEALVIGEMAYFSPSFVVMPSPNMHVYLSTVLDPRDEATPFPDDAAIDLGMLQTPYGEQQYTINASEEELAAARSLVLWDTSFKRVYGFVQLQATE